MIATLVKKDIILFFRNQFFAIVTALGLVMYIAIYFLLPADVDTNIGIGIYIEDPAGTTLDETFAGFFDYTAFNSQAELRAALEETDDYFAGLSISAEQAALIDAGQPVAVDAFYAPGIPADTKSIYDDMLAILINAANPAFAARFQQMDDNATVLGRNIYDEAITTRDRIIPMLLLFVLTVELLGLATLIMHEIETGTARALVTSPLRLSHFFAGKVIMGMLLTLSQLLILLVVTGKIVVSPPLLLTTLLAGTWMITGVAFVIAALSREAMSVMAWGTLVIMVFAIPAISILLPGLSSQWAEIIPSYFLVDALHAILNFGATWADVAGHLAILFAFGFVTFVAGSVGLRRRF